MTTKEENERICERLLKWMRIDQGWIDGDKVLRAAPAFTDWDDAGLIMDALQVLMRQPGSNTSNASDAAYVVAQKMAKRLRHATLGPLNIRAAALEYIAILEAFNNQG